MRRTSALFCAAMMLTSLTAGVVVTSPDGRLVAEVSVDDGVPHYQVMYDGQTAIAESSLGVVTNVGDYTRSMAISDEGEEKQITSVDNQEKIKQHSIHTDARERVITFTQDDKPVMALQLRVSNKDVAFRYMLMPHRGANSCVVTSENTAYRVADNALTFMAPQSKPMTGFARTAPSYETKYSLGEPVGRNGWGFGYTFPCLFEVPNADADKALWIMLSETGTDGGYVGCRLLGGNGGEYRIGFPQEGELNGWGSTSVQMPLPGYTPWRTITIGHTPANIVESTVTWELVEPKYKASRNYADDYGKGMWSWIIGMDSSCNYDEQKRYIDFAAAMGYRSLLVDALWDVQIGRERIAELAKYGKERGVGLYLWYNSNGSWNDAPQSPKHIMNNGTRRKQEMKWMQEIGILGIKVDFFGGDKQPVMQLYEDILSDANDCGLMVIFHGCTLPRGWERMYPNFVASEAVLASENLHFSQGFCDTEARDCGAMYPFTRNTVASMDFGGSALNKYYNANNNRGSRRVTTDVYALATAVLFQSPVQHFALAPNNLTDAPAWAIDFMKAVPTTWDEIRYIDGYPGKYIIMARRSGDKWYIAGVNAMEQPLKQNISLPMFDAKSQVTLYQNGEVKEVKVSRKQTVSIEIPTNGGVVIVQ
ncbi:MAG: glycoside hydrolase family 97 protein [Bacteroidaceae bacterium]|nr:glycoside hydrolase family 97 protein [Bacteroidaceae bacterium]